MINFKLPGWFDSPGAYVLVDGQFGSTGKGLMAGALAELGRDKITHVTTNAGPNSGHTAYFPRPALVVDGRIVEALVDTKIVTQQIPVASVFLKYMNLSPITLLNAGAVVSPTILRAEMEAHGFGPYGLLVHPTAALIHEEDVIRDQQTVNEIAGTGKGIGPALIRKIGRNAATAFDYYRPMLPPGFPDKLGWDRFWDWDKDVVFVETAQGFSLGLNSARFYPNVTSRECTVMQAISDARIPAQRVKKVIACFRTFPIRVGSTATGYSGNCYPDQVEMTWDQIGVEPEMTTVTKRVRRVFSWSRVQFKECVAANEPDVIFLNFANYLTKDFEIDARVDTIISDYQEVLGKLPERILLGNGPYSHDIIEWSRT